MDHLPEFISLHWELFISLLILLGLLFFYEWKTYQQQAKKISPQDAVLLINQHARVLDMRTIEQFDKGHIIDATHVNKDDAPPSTAKKSKQPNIILVCQNGMASQTLASQWQQAGIADIHVLSGGIDAWQDAGFPLVKSKS